MEKENFDLERVIIRPMNPGEEKQIAKIGRSAFGFFEALFVSVPRHAMVADYEGNIAGGILYKPMNLPGGKKVLYMDIGFVHPDYQGMGVGKKLYSETFRMLWETDCDYMTALVKDDNIGSYKPLLQNGYRRVSCKEVLKKFGFLGFLKQYLGTVWFLAGGMDFYMAERKKEKQEEKRFPILCYFLSNLLLLLPMFGMFLLENNSPEKVCFMFLAFATVLFALFASWMTDIFAYFVGSKLGKHKLCPKISPKKTLLLGLGNSLFPMNGNWYLEDYENSEKDRKSMACTELVRWFVFLFLPLAQLSGTVYGKSLAQLAQVFMVYSLIPIYPFEHLGAGRIYRYNKWLWLITTVITIAVLYFYS